MANRHTLHISKLEDFKKWLVKDGWEIEEPKGIYEVLRARKYGRQNPLIVYTKADAKEHLSIMDRDSGVIGAFLKDCRKPKTNADRIRAMNDEELAGSRIDRIDFYTKSDNPEYIGDFEGIANSIEEANKLEIAWLQSEVEEHHGNEK